MTPFEFVAVFFSMVLGLALAHVLAAFSSIVEARERVRTDWIQSIWAVSVTVLIVHSWWGTWGLKNAESWNYASFWAVVVYLGSIYLLSTFVFPRGPEAGVVDLRIHFESVRRIFMALWAVTLLMAGLINYTLFHVGLRTVFVVVPAICAVIAGVGGLTRNRIYQGLLAILFLTGLLIIMVSDQTVLR
jgi:hypothetical protein